MGNLRKVRQDFVETLEEAGIKSVHYNTENIKPPCAIIIPSENYVDLQANTLTMNQWNVSISVMLIAGGTGNNHLDELDDLIEKTVLVLSDPEKGACDIKKVVGPALAKLKNGNNYYTGLIEVEYQTYFLK